MASSAESFFQRLTRIFRSGPAIHRRVKGYDTKSYYSHQLIQGNYGYRASAPFGFGRENSPFSVLGQYGILDRMARYSEFCFHGDTLVYTTNGALTIQELSEKYPNGEIFHVYSYDHKEKKVAIGTAHHPRITKDGVPQKLVEITLDDGTSLKTTLDHKFLLRDGSYIEASELKPGISLMPFIMRKYNGGYHQIYALNKKDNKFGWEKEHHMVAEYFSGRKVEDNEVVHHKDFDPENNLPGNLEIMLEANHKKYHAQLNNKNKLNKPNKAHSRWMKKNNPVARKDITFDKIFDVAVGVGFSMKETSRLLEADPNVLKRRLRDVGFKNWQDFVANKGQLQLLRNASRIIIEMRSPTKEAIQDAAKSCRTIYEAASILGCTENTIRRFLERNKMGTWSELKGRSFDPGPNSKDSALDPSLTYQMICSAYTQGLTKKDLAEKLETTPNKIMTRLKREGFDSYSGWAESYENHKVKAVDFLVEKSVVYNLTVDGHHNVAVGSVNSSDSKAERPYSMVFCRQSEMEYCLHGDTRIAVPGGYKTIKELSEEYGSDKEFIVYSYNHNEKRIVPSLGKQARKTRTDHAYKVTFDNGKEIIGTPNHRLMKRDGTYCQIQDLKPKDAMMPFYRKALYAKKDKKEKSGEYLSIYSMEFDKTQSGWRGEHRIIAEWAYNKEIKENEVVHHKNFVRSDNHPENLQIMDEAEHKRYHVQFLNAKKWDREKNTEWIEKFKKSHSAWMRKNNPAQRKDITFGRILETCENIGFNLYRLCEAFDTDPNVIKRHLRDNGFNDFITFAQAYRPGWKSDSWNNRGEKNPRFNPSVTFAKICEKYQKGMIQKDLAKEFGVSIIPITNRLKENGFSSWSDFTQNYSNLKVAKVEYFGLIDLYDLTVDGYKNFATDTVISHNTPEIATAEDIYADEVVGGDDRGKCFHIYSDNAEIKNALDDLFYDVMNVEFNLKTWVRNLVKYGDFFLYIEVHPDIGIINVTPIPVNEIEREEGFDLEDPYAVRFKWLTRGNKYLENWQVIHLRIMGNDLFLPYGTCLESTTRIEMNDGFKEIKNIQKGDLVAFFDRTKQLKSYSKVLDVVCSGKKPCYRFSTKHNFIDVSKEHQIMFYDSRSEKFEYKNTLDFKLGDLIVIDKEHHTPRLINIDRTKPVSNKNGYWNEIERIPEHVDEEFAKLFGFLVGDGWLSGNSVCFALGENEGQNQYYISLLEKFSGREVKIGRSHFSGKQSQVICHSKMLKTILERMEFTGKSFEKRLPTWAFSAGSSIKEALLEGLYHADGTVFVDKWNCSRYSFELSNEELIKDIKILIQSLGYKTGKICHRPARKNVVIEGRKIKETRDSWYFYYFPSKLKQAKKHDIKNRLTEDFILEPLIAVEEIGEKETWDIHVENENHNFYANGMVVHNSILEPVRRIWRQLIMLEDAMLVYRVARSPERRVFYIDVANVAPNDVPNYMEAAQATLRSRGIIDKETGREDQRLNPMAITDDYFIPVRGNQQGTRIETLAGGQHVTATEDVEYIQSKMFAALKVPKPYMNFDEHLSAKASLAQMDVRFSRTIQNLQKIVIAELNKVAMIHLFSMGFDGADLVSFELKLSNPSSVALQQKLELWSVKFDTGGSAKESKLVDEKWIQKNILELTDIEIGEIEKGLRKDKIREIEIEAIEVKEPDETQPAKTTDIFDPTNYRVPGSDVKKAPPKEGEGEVEISPDEVGLAKIRSYDEEGNQFVVDLESGKAPIMATPFMTRHKRNRKRRVGVGRGRDNMALPNMAAMLSAKNKYTADIHGQRTEAVEYEAIKKQAEKELDYRIEIEPKFSREMESLFEKLRRIIKPKKSSMLTEDFELDLSDETDDADDILNEVIGVVSEEQKEDTGNEGGEAAETIEEKTLSEVFNEDS